MERELDTEAFYKVYIIESPDDMDLQDEYLFVWPIIHISCHGNEDGIKLTNNELIPWSKLYDLLSVRYLSIRGIRQLSYGTALCRRRQRKPRPVRWHRYDPL